MKAPTTSRFLQRDSVFAWGVSMARKPPPPPPPPPKGKKGPPPPPPPPPKGKKGPPPPPKVKKSPPPKPKKAAPPPPEPPKKAAPPPPRPKKAAPAPPKGGKPRRRKGKRPAAKGAKTTQKGKPRKRGRRIRIKLGLRQSRITEKKDSYEDQMGWTVTQQVLEPFEDLESQESDILTHQCSMCGSIMQIPHPKRERYKVICAYSECGHEDMIGF